MYFSIPSYGPRFRNSEYALLDNRAYYRVFVDWKIVGTYSYLEMGQSQNGLGSYNIGMGESQKKGLGSKWSFFKLGNKV